MFSYNFIKKAFEFFNQDRNQMIRLDNKLLESFPEQDVSDEEEHRILHG